MSSRPRPGGGRPPVRPGGGQPPLRMACLHSVLAASMALPSVAQAQDVRPLLPAQLPRPGYEQRVLRSGATTLASEIGVEARYDSNIFAVSQASVDDMIVRITPRLQVDSAREKMTFHAELFADIREYTSNRDENRAGFGATAKADLAVDRRNRLRGGLRAERVVESRNDPEAADRIGLSPRLINVVAANLDFRHERSRFAVDLRGSVERFAYLEPEDADRSLVSMRGDVRLSRIFSSRLAWFVDGYVNRRDNDRSFDRSDIDRDTTTLGATTGARLAISDRWSGEAGIGVFRANPDDVTLPSFTGLAASADLTWSPTRRTAVTIEGFSGDVATVRAGASGRVDSRIGVRIDQEIRHNLLFNIGAGYRSTVFRGVPDSQRTVTVAAGAEYLFNRFLSLFVDVNHVDRSADRPTDAFRRTYVGIGLRLRH